MQFILIANSFESYTYTEWLTDGGVYNSVNWKSNDQERNKTNSNGYSWHVKEVDIPFYLKVININEKKRKHPMNYL